MSGQIRYSDEFKIDAVAQVTERGYPVKEVVERLGISTKSLHTSMAKFSQPLLISRTSRHPREVHHGGFHDPVQRRVFRQDVKSACET